MLRLTLLISAAAVSAYAQTVSFSNFSSTAGLTLNGTAAVVKTEDGNVLRLTPAKCCSAGRAFTATVIPFQIGADTFSTFFQFRITNPGGIGAADGILFVLRTPGATRSGPAVLYMGYDGVGKGLIVKLDTYQNAGEINDNYVEVQANGDWLEGTERSPYQTTNCTSPVGVPGCMANGDLWSAWIDFDGTNLHVALTDNSTIRPPDLVVAPLSLPAILDYANGVYVGFTAGTGGGFENHDIVNWLYDSAYSPTAVGAAQVLPSTSETAHFR